MSDVTKRVTAIQGIPVSPNTPTIGQVLQFSGATGVYLTGSIAEVLVYDGILNSSDRRLLEAYITTRYGIAIGS